MSIFKSDIIENSGDNWLIADFGTDADNQEYIVVTDHVHASELHQFSKGAKEDSELVAMLLNRHYGKAEPLSRNASEPVVEQAKRLILSCESVDQLLQAERDADRLCNDAMRNIRYAQERFSALGQLRRAQLSGATLYDAPPGAEWVVKALGYDSARPTLQHMHVIEWCSLRWMVASDGFRMHCHGCTCVPAGVYDLVEGHLLPVADVKLFAAMMDVTSAETEPVGKLPDYWLYSNSDNPDLAGWFRDGDLLAGGTESSTNYSVQQEYLSDALSFGEAQYALEPVKTNQEYLKVFSDPPPQLRLFWPDAFAVIMPMSPAR